MSFSVEVGLTYCVRHSTHSFMTSSFSLQKKTQVDRKAIGKQNITNILEKKSGEENRYMTVNSTFSSITRVRVAI